MFLESKTYQLYPCDDAAVSFNHLGLISISRCLYEYVVYVYIYFQHDLSVSIAGQVRKLSCLVGVKCLFQVYDFDKHVMLFLERFLGYTWGWW